MTQGDVTNVGHRIAFALLAGVLAGCSDYGRECSLHFKLVQTVPPPTPAVPLAGIAVALSPVDLGGTAALDTAEGTPCREYRIATNAQGTACFVYLQRWSGSARAPTVVWQQSLTNDQLVVAQQPDVYAMFVSDGKKYELRQISHAGFGILETPIATEKENDGSGDGYRLETRPNRPTDDDPASGAPTPENGD